MSAIGPRPQSAAYLQEAVRDCRIRLPSLSGSVDTIVQVVREQITHLAHQGNKRAEHHKRQFEMLDLGSIVQKQDSTVRSETNGQLPDSSPPEIGGIILGYLPPEAVAALPPVLDVVSTDSDSDSARHTALVTRDTANRATMAANAKLLNVLNQVIGGATSEFDSATASALADVHHVEGLNGLFKKCTSAEMLQQVILFLTVHCPHLRELDLSEVKNLEPSHLLLLSKFRLLHTLSLAKTSIDDTHVEALQGLQLETLNLRQTRINGSTLHTLSRGIKELNLEFCESLT